MTIEKTGPGGIGNVYGVRTTNTPTKIGSAKPKDVYNGFDAGAVPYFSEDGKLLIGVSDVISIESWAGFGGSSLVTTVYIGDSITANGWLQNLKTAFDSYGPYFYDDGTATGTRFARTEDYGFAAWADFLASGALGTFINSGIGGNTTTQILARVDTDVLAYKPLLVVDECGTNDIIAGSTAAALIANKLALFTKYRSIGAKIIAFDIAPRAGFDATMKQVAVDVNRWLYQQAATQRDISVVPYSTVMGDPASAVGDILAARSFDDTHPNNVGGFFAGKMLADHASRALFLPQSESIWTGDAYGTSQATAVIRNSNPGMSGSGGTANTGVTGTVAAGYTCSRLAGAPNVVASVVPRDDGRGFSQRLVITFGAAADAVEFGIPTGSSRYQADGRKMGLSTRIEVAAGSAEVINRMLAYTSANVGGVLYQATGLNQQDTTRRGNLPVAAGYLKGVLKTPRIQIAAGAAASYDSRIRIYGSAAGTVTLDISEYKMTQHP